MEDPNQAVWVTEALTPIPRDIYDITKLAAEQLCEDFYRHEQLETICLRVSRFWHEPLPVRLFYRMYRGLDVQDVSVAHLLAISASEMGFEVFNISSQSPFAQEDVKSLKQAPLRLINAKVLTFIPFFVQRGWGIPTEIDRVYVINKAKRLLSYQPRVNIEEMLGEFA